MLSVFPSDDITIIYLSANVVPLAFQSKTYTQLLKAAQGIDIIAVTHKPMPIDEQNIVVDLPRSQAAFHGRFSISPQIPSRFLSHFLDSKIF